MRLDVGTLARLFKARTRNGGEFDLAAFRGRTVWRDYFLAMLRGYSPGMQSHDGGIETHPADFVVGPDGRIVHAHYGANYADSMTAADVVMVVNGMPSGRVEDDAILARLQASAAIQF